MNFLPGTVTVFSRTGCKHCEEAIRILSGRGLRHVVVLELDVLPLSVRNWMLEHTEQAKTVPQWFLNDQWFAGGLRILKTLHETGALDLVLEAHLDKPLNPASSLHEFASASVEEDKAKDV